jgi:hypothetical protein
LESPNKAASTPSCFGNQVYSPQDELIEGDVASPIEAEAASPIEEDVPSHVSINQTTINSDDRDTNINNTSLARKVPEPVSVPDKSCSSPVDTGSKPSG